MNVVIIDGIMGAGKTLGMTLLTTYFSLKSGCTQYSNYGIRGSKPFTHYRDFIDVAMQPSSVIALDESHTDLDSRNFNTNAVKFFTHLVFYFRKMRTTMFLATPIMETLDNRVRSVCNLYCRCSKDQNYFYYDMYDLQANRFLRRYKIKQELAFEIASQLYDTHNIVTPMEFPSDREEFKSLIHDLKETIDKYYLDKSVRSVGGGLRPQAAADDRILQLA